MNPVKQTVLHDPEKGKHGNCLSAVLASLLHLPIEDVPVFSAPYPEWQNQLNEWLRPFGLAYIQVGDFAKWCNDFGIRGCHHELGGSSPRNTDISHACVGVDGDLVFDPHPDNSGLANIEASGIFIALEPWRYVLDGVECPAKEPQ